MHLLIGSDGYIGRELARHWLKWNLVFCKTTRRKKRGSRNTLFLDLNQPSNFQIEDYDTVTLCAGISSSRQCAVDPSATRVCNVVNTMKLAQAAIDERIYFLFLSTTHVFDGVKPFYTTLDKAGPVTEYGHQKRKIEELLLNHNTCGILRLTKIHNDQSRLLRQWKENIRSNKPVQAFDDVFISPIDIRRVVEKITSMIIGKTAGIQHLGGEEEISYYEYACQQVSSWGYPKDLVIPVSCPKSEEVIPRHASLK
jgi:dTDP-4-dehydrorhamnose reductase